MCQFLAQKVKGQGQGQGQGYSYMFMFRVAQVQADGLITGLTIFSSFSLRSTMRSLAACCGG